MQPSLILNFDNLTEALVLRELSIDTFKVSLVMLKDFNKAIHAELVPPAALFEQSKASSQDVANVAATSDIRGQRAIRYRNEDCPRMVQHDEHLFNDLD